MKRKILVVDDDKNMVDLIRLYLERDGYRVVTAYDGGRAMELYKQERPDLIVLDLMLPFINGLDICRVIRAESRVPIIMLTARTTEDDKLLGLDVGADDYVTKPFSPREVVARVRTVLRRATEEEEAGPSEVRHGDLTIDILRHEVRRKGALLHMTPKEFKILTSLASEPGRAFSRAELLEKVLGLDYPVFERTLDAHIMNLRKKIEDDPDRPSLILTVYGVGYKFAEVRDAP
jgi:DNA-binding response OmpR family regulator